MAEPPTLAGGVKASEAVVAEGVMVSIDGMPGAKVSEEVITPVPSLATATKNPLPKVILIQALFAAKVLLVQVIPLGLVITRLLVPFDETATKSPLPKVTLFQLLSAAEVPLVQVIPLGLVITRLFTPEVDTATKSPLP